MKFPLSILCIGSWTWEQYLSKDLKLMPDSSKNILKSQKETNYNEFTGGCN